MIQEITWAYNSDIFAGTGIDIAMCSRVEQKRVAGNYIDIGHGFGNGFELGFGKRTWINAPAGSIGAGYAREYTGDKKSKLFFHVENYLKINVS